MCHHYKISHGNPSLLSPIHPSRQHCFSRAQTWPYQKSTMASYCLQHNVKFLSPTAANCFNLTTVPFCHSLCLSLLFCFNCVMQRKVLQTWNVSSCFMLLSLLSACLSITVSLILLISSDAFSCVKAVQTPFGTNWPFTLLLWNLVSTSIWSFVFFLLCLSVPLLPALPTIHSPPHSNGL